MNKLDYSISLREKGLGAEEIKKKMRARGFSDAQTEYYFKKSDEIFLNQSVNYRKSKSKGKHKNSLKMITLALSFMLLICVFLGYAKIGLLGLFFVWTLIGYSSYRK